MFEKCENTAARTDLPGRSKTTTNLCSSLVKSKPTWLHAEIERKKALVLYKYG